MKRVANTSKPPVVVPVIVVLVDVDVALVVIPAVERGELYKIPSVPPPLEYSQGCIVFGIIYALVFCTKYLQFFEVSTHTTLPEAMTADMLDVWILASAVGSRNRRHIRQKPFLSYHKNNPCMKAGV